MANVEGNEIALRSVLGENLPKPRDGSDAREDNDNKQPFKTVTYETNVFGFSENIAPAWCYGMTYESDVAPNPANSNSYTENNPTRDQIPIYVAFGVRPETPFEGAVLYPGQTLNFPRGTRRVYVRKDFVVSGNQFVITWKLDPYASKTYSPAGAVATQLIRGDGIDQDSPNGGDRWSLNPVLPKTVFPREQLVISINNVTAVAVNYSLSLEVAGQIDAAVIAAGTTRVFMYSPSLIVASLPAGVTGHNTVFSASAQISCTPAAPLPPGAFLIGRVWYR